MSEMAELYGYEPQPIDIDRGARIRFAPTGEQVIMYKSMPGLYLDPAGRPVSDERAAAAGFAVEADRREATTRAEVRRATEAILARQAEVEREIRTAADPAVRARLAQVQDLQPPVLPAEPPPPPTRNVVVTQANGQGEPRGTKDFEMRHHGGGRWVVFDRASGKPVSEPMSSPDAVAELLALQGDADQESDG